MKALLTEVSYTLPDNGPAAFWDFYALNYLWFRIGSGHEAMYGGKIHPGRVANDMRSRVIDEVFDKCARKLLRELSIYLVYAAVKEFHHYPDRTYTIDAFKPHSKKRPADALLYKLASYQHTAMNAETIYEDLDAEDFYIKVQNGLKEHDITLQDIHDTFTTVHWDRSYGGEVWGEILEIAEIVGKKLNNLALKDVVGYIDKIYDLQHNTGSVLNKGRWEVLNTDLDKRHDIKDIREFLPKVTHVVKALILNSLPYFEKGNV